VEDFPAERDGMTFPWKVKRFIQPTVERDITGRSQNIAVAYFARPCITEAGVSSVSITEEVWSTSLRRGALQRMSSYTKQLHVPVCGPDAAIIGTKYWNPTVPAENTSPLPSTEYPIHQTV